jgi:hypothetical protein
MYIYFSASLLMQVNKLKLLSKYSIFQYKKEFMFYKLKYGIVEISKKSRFDHHVEKTIQLWQKHVTTF